MNTDYSKAIILAALKEFNCESLQDFLIRVFKILRMEASNEDFKFMVPHVGCSHFMSIMHRKLKAIVRSRKKGNSNRSTNTKCQEDDVWYRFNMYCVSLLVNARTLDEFDSILEDVATCLLNERQNNDVLKAFTRLCEMIHNMEDKDKAFNAEEACMQDESNIDVEGTNLEDEVHCNPFHIYYGKLIATYNKRVIKRIRKNNRTLDPVITRRIIHYLTLATSQEV
jgi:hypothetical protein